MVNHLTYDDPPQCSQHSRGHQIERDRDRDGDMERERFGEIEIWRERGIESESETDRQSNIARQFIRAGLTTRVSRAMPGPVRRGLQSSNPVLSYHYRALSYYHQHAVTRGR